MPNPGSGGTRRGDNGGINRMDGISQMDNLNIFLWQIFIIGLLIFAGLMTLIIVVNWKIFTKAGKPGWAAIVPFYRGYTFSAIVFGNAGYFIAFTVAIIAMTLAADSDILSFATGMAVLYLHTLFSIKLSMVFGKGAGFMVGMIYLPMVFKAILAFGSAEYIGTVKRREGLDTT